ncbi:hypothetical protein JTB14_009178 [Gonioctena quinquepunctata]|nr:hypothetical protein JTB14_009178 [Gonioctena quinquepunctata]
MKWHSGTVIRSTVGNSVPVAVTNLETSSSMKELRKMTLPNKHSKMNFEENSSWLNDEVSPIINLPDHDNIDSDKAEHSEQDNLQIVHNIILCFRPLSEYTQEKVEVEGHITVGSME